MQSLTNISDGASALVSHVLGLGWREVTESVDQHRTLVAPERLVYEQHRVQLLLVVHPEEFATGLPESVGFAVHVDTIFGWWTSTFYVLDPRHAISDLDRIVAAIYAALPAMAGLGPPPEPLAGVSRG